MKVTIKFCITVIFVFLFCQVSSAQIGDTPPTIPLEYQSVPTNLLDSEILLTDKKTKIKLNDYKDKTIVLSLVTEWATPARRQMTVLSKFYEENPNNLQIIAVSIENEDEDKIEFRKYVKKNKIKFQTGWANEQFNEEFTRISKFTGVPQTFVIKNGKFYGVFLGGSEKVNQQIIDVIRNTLKN